MHYGNFALTRALGVDKLTYTDFTFTKGMTAKDILIATAHNLSMLFQSMTRLNERNSYILKRPDGKPRVTEIAGLQRDVQGVSLTDFLPGFATENGQRVWLANYKKLLTHKRVVWLLDRIASIRRFVNLVFFVPSTITLTEPLSKLLIWIWRRLGLDLPRTNGSSDSTFRFYVSTSFVSGVGSAKYIELTTYPKAFVRMLCFLPGDLSFNDTLKLCGLVKCRMSYNVDDRVDGKRVQRDSELYNAVRDTWRDHPGSSGFPPLLFTRTRDKDAFKRITHHYCRHRSSVFKFASGKKAKVVTNVGAAHLVLISG